MECRAELADIPLLRMCAHECVYVCTIFLSLSVNKHEIFSVLHVRDDLKHMYIYLHLVCVCCQISVLLCGFWDSNLGHWAWLQASLNC